MVRAVVTGGAGFIGSSIVRGLLEKGHSVRVLDNFASGRKENLEEVLDDVELLEGDVRDPGACLAACEGIEVLLHQAAIGSVPLSIEDPVTAHKVNVDGTLNVLLAARERGVRRFVFASSSSVYGDAPERVKSEDLPPRPMSPYAVSKLAGEAYACAFHKVYGLEAVPLRYFNIFGPRQDPDSMYAAVVPRFTTCLLEGRPPRIFGDGGQTRDFTYVENVVRANLLALECPREACGRPYNIACGTATSVSELFRRIRHAVGGEALRVQPGHEPPQRGDVRDSLASIEAARKHLGYEPLVGLAEGIGRTIEWYRSMRAAKASSRR
ncbi:MAG: SDR family oxidoreductase [Planctomycetes bacterium]|nr:SDR family oxidoreductase [Planctomycetota bacterium]